jgi:type IV secretion system protein TrbE
MTFPSVIHRLTNLRLLNYTITVNVDPLPVGREITKEEKAHERIAGDFASEGKLSLKAAMQNRGAVPRTHSSPSTHV